MDLWMKIGSAVLMGMMLVFLFPRAKQMLQDGPKGTSQEWISALIPLALVVGFVVLLMALM
ncbi:MAG: archaellum biogenesis protein FlaJ (TadC family) [Gammaproteobacteria bacterium]|jgi:archaellum biogenesis protein FlaJ (TadC family)